MTKIENAQFIECLTRILELDKNNGEQLISNEAVINIKKSIEQYSNLLLK